MKKATARETCVGCENVEPKAALRVAPCGHHYCGSCLKCMGRLALKDRTLLPLRCCRKELSIQCVQFGFSLSSSKARGVKDFETYKRLLEDRKHDWKSSDLVSDAEYSQTVREIGAKRCPACGIGVQRDFGCVHMTCSCTHQFCYTCLAAWGSCSCALIPEDEVRAILGE